MFDAADVVVLQTVNLSVESVPKYFPQFFGVTFRLARFCGV